MKALLIRGAETFSRGKIFKKAMPRDIGGALWVTPESGLRYWWRPLGKIDPALLQAAREWVRPGSVVWDIGANVGLFAFASASLAASEGRVLAVEADLFLVSLLRRSAELRSVEKAKRAEVEVLPVAIAGEVGIGQFEIAQRARASNSLSGFGTSQKGGTRQTQSVVTVSLDWLLERRPAPDVVKIDVEGAEQLVLQGATRLLETARPLILCEVTANPQEVMRLFHDCNYQLFDMDVAPAQRAPLQQPTLNVIACPCEKIAQFKLPAP